MHLITNMPSMIYEIIELCCHVLQLVVDVVAYDSPEILDKLYLKKLRNSEIDPKDPGHGCRFVLPLPKEKTVSSAHLLKFSTNWTASE